MSPIGRRTGASLSMPARARFSGGAPDGNSAVTVTDAEGRIIATVDPATRERKNLRGAVIGRHPIATANEGFIQKLVRPRTKRAYAPERPAPIKYDRRHAGRVLDADPPVRAGRGRGRARTVRP